MAGVWGRVMHAFGFGPDAAEYEDELEESAPLPAREPVRETIEEPADLYSARSPRRGTLVSLPSQTRDSFKVLVVEPRSFDEVQTIVDQLKSRRPVILNLESLDKDLASRILNFLNGAVYALGGETQKVATGIFFFAPTGVDVSTLGRGYTGSAIGGGALDDPEAAPGTYAARPVLSRDPLEELLAKHRQQTAPAAQVAAGAEGDAKPKSPWENWGR